MKNLTTQRDSIYLLLLPLTAAILTIPMVLHGTSCGHDLTFHMQSWMEAARQWKTGVVYPRWAESANYGAGEPRFIFYPPLSWMVGAWIGSLVGWENSANLFVFVVLTAAAFAMYILANASLGRRPAIMAAVLYISNPYTLFVVYERSAFAELMAQIWIPLLFAALLRSRVSIAAVAATFAAVWLTNAPSGVMATYSAVLIALYLCWRKKDWRVLARTGAGMLLGWAVAAVYMVPAWYEGRWVQITRAVETGFRPQDNFLFGHTGDPFHDHVLWTASWIVVMLATAIFLSLLLPWLRPRAELAREPLGTVFGMAGLLYAAILLLQFRLSAPLWALLPELHYMQFPWRWALVLGIAYALCVAVALSFLFRERLWVATAAATTLFAVTTLIVGYHHLKQECDPEDKPAGIREVFNNEGFEGIDEYTPVTADNSEIPLGLPEVKLDPSTDATVRINVWRGNRRSFQVRSRRDATATIRLLDYPAWKLKINGAEAHKSAADNGQMQFDLTAGESEVEISWRTTADQKIGLAVSGCGVLAVLALAVFDRKTRRELENPRAARR